MYEKRVQTKLTVKMMVEMMMAICHDDADECDDDDDDDDNNDDDDGDDKDDGDDLMMERFEAARSAAEESSIYIYIYMYIITVYACLYRH